MKLNDIADNEGARRPRIRVGRGIGSGKGKTSGSGQKGQKARAGVSLAGFEGGQMPLYRRLPKRGFKNPFRRDYAEVNLGRLQGAIDAKRLDPKKPVDAAALVAAGVIRRAKDGVRLLGHGELSAKVEITVAGATKSAISAVEKAGGKVNIQQAAAGAEETKGAEEKKAAKADADQTGAAAEGDSSDS